MKWKKLGKIFDTAERYLPNNCFGFAQSPQALVFEDFVRVYFSTREKEPKSGKYLSHIAFVDFKKNFKDIIKVSRHSVIELGNLGCYDEHGIFPLNVFRYCEKIYGVIGGWNRRVSVSVDTSIGLSVSKDDGLTFQRIGNGPVLSSSLKEPFLVGDPFVNYFNDQFHMWYIFGTQWKKYADDQQPDRTYKIGHAVSANGYNWVKEEDGRRIISDKLGPNESQALPTVAFFNGLYHMFFCYRESFDFRKNSQRGYRIGYAFSEDLHKWVRDDDSVGIDVSSNGWDSDMLCYPHVFSCDNNVYLLYNGNEFGRYGFGLAILE